MFNLIRFCFFLVVLYVQEVNCSQINSQQNLSKSYIRLSQINLYEVSKYFESADDFINLECVCKKMKGYTCRFKYNPIPLSKEWMLTALFQNISTLVLYDDNDDMWETDKIKNYVVAYPTNFEDCIIDFYAKYIFKEDNSWRTYHTVEKSVITEQNKNTSCGKAYNGMCGKTLKYFAAEQTQSQLFAKNSSQIQYDVQKDTLDINEKAKIMKLTEEIKDKSFYIFDDKSEVTTISFKKIIADQTYAKLFCYIDDEGELKIREDAPSIVNFTDDCLESFSNVVCGKTYAKLFCYIDNKGKLKTRKYAPSIVSFTDDCFDDLEKDRVVSIKIPETVKKLGRCLNRMKNLEEVILPDSLEVLDGSFYGCKKFILKKFPANLKEIRGGILKESGNCFVDELITINLPTSVNVIESIFCDDDREYDEKIAIDISCLQEFKEFGGFVFNEPQKLITICEKLPGLYHYVMYSTLLPDTIAIPCFVERIKHNAFAYSSVQEIIIPNEVEIENGFLNYTSETLDNKGLKYIMYPYKLRDVFRNNIYHRGYICGDTLACVEYETIQKDGTMYEEAYCSYGARTDFFCENKVAGKITKEDGTLSYRDVWNNLDESEDEYGYSFSRNDSEQSSDDSNESESESSSNSSGSEHNIDNNDGKLIASEQDNLTHLS